MPDDDSDGDGTEDCNDNCPDDPDKTEPGQCGCGEPDVDGEVLQEEPDINYRLTTDDGYTFFAEANTHFLEMPKYIIGADILKITDDSRCKVEVPQKQLLSSNDLLVGAVFIIVHRKLGIAVKTRLKLSTQPKLISYPHADDSGFLRHARLTTWK